MNSHIDHPRQTRTESEPPVSVAMDLLSDPRRRHAIDALSRRTDSMTVDELAETLADAGGVDVDCVETLRIELHHCHLPKLAATDLIEYDRRTNRIGPGVALSRIGPLLEAVAVDEGAA